MGRNGFVLIENLWLPFVKSVRTHE